MGMGFQFKQHRLGFDLGFENNYLLGNEICPPTPPPPPLFSGPSERVNGNRPSFALLRLPSTINQRKFISVHL